MAIGPQLPAHLTKRKRDSEEAEAEKGVAKSGSPRPDKCPRTLAPALPPPTKTSYEEANPDEIGLDNLDGDDSDSDDMGPSLPPTASSAAAPGPAARPIGPAMPPPGAQASDNGSDSSSDSDDMMGPAPPPPPGSDTPSASTSVPSRHTTTSTADAPQPAGPQRDAWMLAPPDGADWATKIDPTKLKARRFASGPRAGAGDGSSGGGSGPGAEWTETPEEKRRRLADAVMGVADGGAGGASSARAKGGNPDARNGEGETTGSSEAARRRLRAEQDARTERLLQEHGGRGEALAKTHARDRKGGSKGDAKVNGGQNGNNNDDDDDPSARAFDRDKDMAGASRITHKQRRELMDRAADFGQRFSKGSFL